MKGKRQDRVLGVQGAPSARDRRGHTLQPADLVHEAFVQVVGQYGSWHNARALPRNSRDVRATGVQRRPARPTAWRPRCDASVVTADGLEATREAMIGVRDVLARLAQADARLAHVAELTVVAGADNEEIAAILGVSPTTLERDWKSAQAIVPGVVAEAL